jgi:hypothetical protein
MQISWIDAKVAPGAMTSIQNALRYSKEPTEIVLLLNEQTFVDKPLEGEPKDMWRYIVDHPLYAQCKKDIVTNNDPFWGNANFRRDYITKDGVTYWGEADCYIPLEFFYITEMFHDQYKERPYILTFAGRKMWGDWNIIEHPLVQNLNLDNLSKEKPEEAFLRCDTTMTMDQLYEFNASQGDPIIIKLPRPRIEGAMTTLSEGLPDGLFCPKMDFFHEDYCLELAMPYFNIPQFHVKNILKGHNMVHPDKRANIFNQTQRDNNEVALQKKQECMKNVNEHIKSLYTKKV